MRMLAPALFACLLGAAGPAPAQHAEGTAHGASTMHESMRHGMEAMQAVPPSGDPDRDFAALMRLHHQQAVDMAKTELHHGRSPELKAMARHIIEAQQKEIAQLDRWLATRK